jgi:hypothetical protein
VSGHHQHLALQVASVTTSALSVASKGGVLSQLRQNRRLYRRAVHVGEIPELNMAPVREAIYVTSYASWAAYGLLIHDAVVVGNQALGVLVGLLLVCQVRWYRHVATRYRRILASTPYNTGVTGVTDLSGQTVNHVNLSHPAADHVG